MVTVTNINQFTTMNLDLDGSPMIPMTTNVNKSGGYLEVIVSEVMSLCWLTGEIRQVDRVRVRDDSGSSRDPGCNDSVSSRLGKRSVTTCIHYRFISDTLPLDIRHWPLTFDPIYIGIGMAVKTLLKVKMITLSDYIKWQIKFFFDVKWSL
jgi:hypothetical protein